MSTFDGFGQPRLCLASSATTDGPPGLRGMGAANDRNPPPLAAAALLVALRNRLGVDPMEEAFARARTFDSNVYEALLSIAVVRGIPVGSLPVEATGYGSPLRQLHPQELRDVFAACGSIRRLARLLSVDRTTARTHLRRHGIRDPHGAETSPMGVRRVAQGE